MGRELEYEISATELALNLPIPIVYKPLIDTNTGALGNAGWRLSYRQNVVWGNPKIKLYDPTTRQSLFIKVKAPKFPSGRSKATVYPTADDLFNSLYEHGVTVRKPTDLSFSSPPYDSYEYVVKLENELRKKDELIKDMSRKQDTPSTTIINNLQADLFASKMKIERLVAELEATRKTLDFIEGTTVGIKAALKHEIANLKLEIADTRRRLDEYQNETSLETIQRLNRQSYEAYVESRPMTDDSAYRTDRILKTVSDLIERILNETRGKETDVAYHS